MTAWRGLTNRVAHVDAFAHAGPPPGWRTWEAFAQAEAPAIQGPEALSDKPAYTQFASR